MRVAYKAMHQAGLAHSVECFKDGVLVGGLYGVGLGNLFFGESMFSKKSDASKIALVHLSYQLNKMKFEIIDCQISSNHLLTLGAKLIKREQFAKILNKYCNYNKTILK